MLATEAPGTGGPLQGNKTVIQGMETVSTKRQRIAQLARRMPEAALSSWPHHMHEAWLFEAWWRTRQDGAVGIDGQSAEQSVKNLHGNLADLPERC